uniref:Uncharacterized protein n=1 Tax=Mycena chlorophos TaxID=658473 RepID=A0ABQ0M829_MYCCL|nr:predicted protein [Mycena chlorophos]
MAVSHYLPPSSSVLVALSTLEPPPSPVLDAIEPSCSSDFTIPIVLDFVLDEPTAHRVSVGTFGPRHALDSFNTLHSTRQRPLSINSIHSLNPVSEPAQHTPPSRTIVPSPSNLSANSVNSGASLPPSPSISSQTSPWFRRRFGLRTSKSSSSQVSLSDSQRHLALPAAPSENVPHSVAIPRPVSVFEDTGWLKDMVVELLIDQEGFRFVKMPLRFGGFRKHVRGWCDAPGGGWALFRPAAGGPANTFPFHYAPLEGLPVLRRLTVNNDESRDYISRQATLSLKHPGVYTVHGSESYNGAPPIKSNASFDGKMQWRLEYLVDNKVEESGTKLVDGERLISPVCLLCDPMLLHPAQGRKVKLLNVVKKGMTAKIVAERLELPLKPVGNATPHRRRSSQGADLGKRKDVAGRDGRRMDENAAFVERHILSPAKLAQMLDGV